jgi:hypothetical protein
VLWMLFALAAACTVVALLLVLIGVTSRAAGRH